jgi:hypothetical protein
MNTTKMADDQKLSGPEQIQPKPNWMGSLSSIHPWMAAVPASLASVVKDSVIRLYAVFGPMVVTPFDAANPPVDYQKTLTPEYQAKLAQADKPAVRLGGKQHLHCVSFKLKEDLEAWLVNNPTAEPTLITTREDASRGYVWLAPHTGLCIHSESGEGINWHDTESNIEVLDRNGACLVVVRDHSPAIIDFNDLCWASHNDLRFHLGYRHVPGQFGELIVEGQHGNVALNPHFRADIIGQELEQMIPGIPVVVETKAAQSMAE